MIVAMDLGKERIPWSEQYRHMFLLSMDGNGATCSRVISSLKSNSVLIKYQSDSILYYFSALEPGTHFISVNDDRDIEGILDQFDLRSSAFLSNRGRIEIILRELSYARQGAWNTPAGSSKPIPIYTTPERSRALAVLTRA